MAPAAHTLQSEGDFTSMRVFFLFVQMTNRYSVPERNRVEKEESNNFATTAVRREIFFYFLYFFFGPFMLENPFFRLLRWIRKRDASKKSQLNF